VPAQCKTDRDVAIAESIRDALSSIHIGKRRNLQAGTSVYYSIAGQGDPQHLDFPISYILTSMGDAELQNHCKTLLAWPCVLKNMVGAKASFETMLQRLFTNTVTEVGLATLRCLVNTYDVLLNEPEGVKERLNLSMNTPQCLSGGLPPALLIARKLTDRLLARHDVAPHTAEHDATLLAAMLWTTGAGPFAPHQNSRAIPHRLSETQIAEVTADVATKPEAKAAHKLIQDAQKLLTGTTGERWACCCPDLPSKSNELVQSCLCTSSSTRGAVNATSPSEDRTVTDQTRQQREHLAQSCDAAINDMMGLHNTEARTRTTPEPEQEPLSCTLMGCQHRDSDRCRHHHVDDDAEERSPAQAEHTEPEVQPQQTSHSKFPMNTTCFNVLQQKLRTGNLTIAAAPRVGQEPQVRNREIESCLAESCRHVAKLLPTRHPELIGKAAPERGVVKALALEVALTMIQQAEALAEDEPEGTDVTAELLPETTEFEERTAWLTETLRQNTVVGVWNEIHSLHRGAHFDVTAQEAEDMKWGSSRNRTLQGWQNNWARLETSLTGMQDVRRGITLREEVSAGSLVEADAKNMYRLCAARVSDDASLLHARDVALARLCDERVPGLNTTYGDQLKVTGGLSISKYASAVMPCAVNKVIEHLISGIHEATDLHAPHIYNAPQCDIMTLDMLRGRHAHTETLLDLKLQDAFEQAMRQQIENRREAIIKAETRGLPVQPAGMKYVYSTEHSAWVGVSVGAGSVCASITATAFTMVGEVVTLINIKQKDTSVEVDGKAVWYDLTDLVWMVDSLAANGRYTLRCIVEPKTVGLRRKDVKGASARAENMQTVMYHVRDPDAPDVTAVGPGETTPQSDKPIAKKAKLPASPQNSSGKPSEPPPRQQHSQTTHDPLAQMTRSEHPSQQPHSQTTYAMSSQEQQSPVKKPPSAHEHQATSQHGRGDTGTPVVTKRLGGKQPSEQAILTEVLIQTMDVTQVCMELIETPERVNDAKRAILMAIEGIKAESVMKEIHRKMTADGLKETVLKNCHKCGIDCFQMPLDGEIYHSGWRKKSHVNAPAVPEAVQAFSIGELPTLAVNCNLSVPCGRCAEAMHLLQAGYYEHTSEVCPLNDAHMCAYATQVVARATRKAALAHKLATTQSGTELMTTEKESKRSKQQSHAQPAGLDSRQTPDGTTRTIKLNPDQPRLSEVHRPPMVPALQQQHPQQMPYQHGPRDAQWQRQEGQRCAQTANAQPQNPMTHPHSTRLKGRFMPARTGSNPGGMVPTNCGDAKTERARNLGTTACRSVATSVRDKQEMPPDNATMRE